MADLEARLINGQYALAPNPKRGGMADVFQASDLLQGARKVALKLFKREYHAQPASCRGLQARVGSIAAVAAPCHCRAVRKRA